MNAFTSVDCTSGILPRNRLAFQKLFEPLTLVESTPAAFLDPAMRETCFVVNGHGVDVDGAVIRRSACGSTYTVHFTQFLPRFNLLGDSEASNQVFSEDGG